MTLLEIRGITLGEDNKSMVISFDSGETCIISGVNLSLLSEVFKEMVLCYGGCGSSWKPLTMNNVDPNFNSANMVVGPQSTTSDARALRKEEILRGKLLIKNEVQD